MIDHLDDIASDLSVFHRIADAGEMDARVFFSLVTRLPAYSGAVASVVAHHRAAGGAQPPQRRTVRSASRYDGNAKLTGIARNADTAPPATAASFAALNAQLGQTWFSHRVVPGRSREGGKLDHALAAG